ncbi:LytTR family DNA-binding domain-containing protein [Hymenobacter aerilatus]|uniref:LytTR family DNA-binding domain-containing protein n=1 Tax=Hymenobacter aerilatus TaxID=2932251 RepID=A0A8T9SV85_9BACT|nr:LytTR family DNA-binding domain-containing protein [Hymenobacter aerilatus]UOR05291.1 LytTR family DNA-binding domain-containing protein [Hymenobacter aerilatus]
MESSSAVRRLSCVLIDDEPLALDVLAGYCAQLPFLTVQAQFHEATAALAYLRTQPVDVVFLDIQMPGLNGLHLAQLLPAPAPRIIFTTAYDQYAVRSYELNATDYLLKPVAFERFVQAVSKVYSGPGRSEPALPTLPIEPPPEAILVRHEGQLRRVAFSEIQYIEGRKEYLLLHTTQGRLLTLQSFRRAEEVLPPTRFVRIHRSYLIALAHIEYLERGRVRVAGQFLPIGDTYREAFLERLRGYEQL